MSEERDELADVIDIDRPGRLLELSPDECRNLAANTPIGRIGFITDQGPIVLPVNFAWFEGAVVFRTLEGQKLAASEGQAVCFEIDEWNRESRTGWSVVIKGTAHEVTDWAEQAQLELLDLLPWARQNWRRIWVRVDPTEITGRLLR